MRQAGHKSHEIISSSFQSDQSLVNALLSATSRAVNEAGNFKWIANQNFDTGQAYFELKTKKYTYKIIRRDLEEDQASYDLHITSSKKTGEIDLYREFDSARIQQWFLKLEEIKGHIPFTTNILKKDADFDRREEDRDQELREEALRRNLEEEYGE